MKTPDQFGRLPELRRWLSAGALFVSALLFASVAVADTLIPIGASWRYLDTGIDQGTAWRQTNFNDTVWASGPSQLGLGDGDEATIVNGGPAGARYPTIYFRRTFEVTNRAALTNFALRLMRDDGGIVYLNGVEVFRSNMPDVPAAYNTFAAFNVGGSEESAFFTAAIPPALLLSGTNVVAVEIHQDTPTSSDLSFSFELLANTPLGNLAPSATVSISSSNQIVATNELFQVSIAAADPETSVSSIDVYQDGILLGTVPTNLLTFNWNHPTPGIHEYVARPRDSMNMLGVSAPGRVLVTRAGFQAQSIFFPQFTSANGLIVQDSVSISSNILHLTQTSNGSRGGVWLAAQQGVLSGFVSEFRFRIISKIGGGGDGLSFNIAGATQPNIGGSIGYNGITNSLSVEFDTFMNTSANDPDDHHISVHSRGLLANSTDESAALGTYTPAADFSDGIIHKVKIEYVPGTLRVFLDNLVTPVLTVNVDLGTLLSLPNGSAWIGLAAGSGASYEYHDISAWSFTSFGNVPPTIALSSPAQALRIPRGTNLTLSAAVNDPNGNVTVVEFYDGFDFLGEATNAPFNFVWSNPPAGIHSIIATATDNGGLFGVSTPVVVEILSGNASVTLFPNFAAASNLTLQGNAAVVANRLRLTPATNSQTGGAWLAGKQPVQFGFETVFQFQVSQPSSKGADGFAFVILGQESPALGDAGAGLGYSSIANSFAIEFDTFQNAEAVDLDDNHIGIHSRGTTPNSTDESASLALVTPSIDMSDGAIHTVVIRYAGGMLKVFLDDLNNQPVLELPVDLATLLDLENGSAWVGFTAATGGHFENHDILMWSFRPNNAAPQIQLISPGAGPFYAPTNLLLSANASDPDGDVALVEFFVDGSSIGTTAQFPFTIPWNNLSEGTYVLHAAATDEFGIVSTSPGVTLSFLPKPFLSIPAVQTNGSVVIAFGTISGRTYTVQYSADLVNWTNAVPSLNGTGALISWHDTGPPVTDSQPQNQPQRFYRVSVSP